MDFGLLVGVASLILGLVAYCAPRGSELPEWVLKVGPDSTSAGEASAGVTIEYLIDGSQFRNAPFEEDSGQYICFESQMSDRDDALACGADMGRLEDFLSVPMDFPLLDPCYVVDDESAACSSRNPDEPPQYYRVRVHPGFDAPPLDVERTNRPWLLELDDGTLCHRRALDLQGGLTEDEIYDCGTSSVLTRPWSALIRRTDDYFEAYQLGRFKADPSALSPAYGLDQQPGGQWSVLARTSSNGPLSTTAVRSVWY